MQCAAAERGSTGCKQVPLLHTRHTWACLLAAGFSSNCTLRPDKPPCVCLCVSALNFICALSSAVCRWYLPAHQTHVSLPLHFDYAAGPSAAGAWLPLLRQTPLTAVLTPPAHQHPLTTPAALSFQGSLGPGGSFSVASSNADGSNPGGVLGFGRQLGFLGLGFGPASRAVAASSRQRGGRSWLGLGFGRSRNNRKSNAAAPGTTDGAVFRAGGVDVGSGVVVPEREWLVPSWGRMGMAVELEMPLRPEPDLVQVRLLNKGLSCCFSRLVLCVLCLRLQQLLDGVGVRHDWLQSVSSRVLLAWGCVGGAWAWQ
jgi:hypothetical protein